jgi:hypothetical protein
VIFAADPDIRYETVVRHGRGARSSSRKPMFFDARLHPGRLSKGL